MKLLFRYLEHLDSLGLGNAKRPISWVMFITLVPQLQAVSNQKL